MVYAQATHAIMMDINPRYTTEACPEKKNASPST
jgi:hypothetical protein